ncbi:Alpha/Beta hydrolase protein [Trametes elegans]|nr:Alpha/Beta hydrolase protein [Trametes elegans]
MSVFSQSDIRRIQLEHIQQLSQLEIPPPEQTTSNADPPWLFPVVLRNTLLDWISSNRKAIRAARDSQCTSVSHDVPNWDTVLFTLVESTAMYLRKDKDVLLAIAAARKGDIEAAERHLTDSQVHIDAIARALNCTFVQLCDFAEQPPDGLWFSSGAYAGLFISNDTRNPFAGIAFKGSNSIADFVTDMYWKPPVKPTKGVLWGAPTHRGFYLGLFGQFTRKGEKLVPFNVLFQQLDKVYKHPTTLHFTGHSLGGAFATLAYGELLRCDKAEIAQEYDIGDLYTFGAPRTSGHPFAARVNELTIAVEGGGRYLFRIVNNGDMVSECPLRELSNFQHVGGGWKLTKKGPEQIRIEAVAETESDSKLLPSANEYSTFTDSSASTDPSVSSGEMYIEHDPRKYYSRWQQAPHST